MKKRFGESGVFFPLVRDGVFLAEATDGDCYFSGRTHVRGVSNRGRQFEVFRWRIPLPLKFRIQEWLFKAAEKNNRSTEDSGKS